MKNELTVSSRPCDVEYRAEAAAKSLAKAIQWIEAIDPAALAASPYGIETSSVLLEKLRSTQATLSEVCHFLPQKAVTRPKKPQADVTDEG